ncbi:hypothetical protein HanRHA438_Chr15g0705371 [Helianthus annuus]|uniref:Uncharacterized protein n=1 Tax=Helianthus annuus TaxID=4232 RepID=A0A251S8D8_HELAN|nr:hypothetical protein HanXRQr2_Chr15g0693031 [Helianthus annuus]KAJ0451183.1 hypothetical protein HanHA300_Chr15g0564711 [Helianthus annuus]KAJ0455613.1 hypothetical protein HanIR_Chr15g0753181 [Helianthus annuus]KAJ0473053.1 hypothetical protein HanHA89_Chr15g0614001 [Helianthus annuus]KAJ0648655.1 hypothetical protein HanLR1_Chr15g0575371 [Helianthus annuus]
MKKTLSLSTKEKKRQEMLVFFKAQKGLTALEDTNFNLCTILDQEIIVNVFVSAF